MSTYHIPALLAECISGLNINPDGNYVDVTYGGGGHTREILKNLKKGKVLAFDQDEDAFRNKIDDIRLTLIHGNFRYMRNYLRYFGVEQVDGIIADLGISFHQVDEFSRGFSFKSDADIDMRMNRSSDRTASRILNEYDCEKLAFMFKEFGELHQSWKIAQAISEFREKQKLEKIVQLVKILEKFAPPKMENKFYAKVFQALRIELNQEIEALKEFLESTASVLRTGGRLVVISYHSLEDRLVKNYMKSGNFDGTIEKDIYGRFETPFNMVNKKIIVPSDDEITSNPRSRSAKLRIAEKNNAGRN
jgi:16S rRNA (cytosine1402-N4)-methyltransferase